jgi:hypothetical protein
VWRSLRYSLRSHWKNSSSAIENEPSLLIWTTFWEKEQRSPFFTIRNIWRRRSNCSLANISSATAVAGLGRLDNRELCSGTLTGECCELRFGPCGERSCSTELWLFVVFDGSLACFRVPDFLDSRELYWSIMTDRSFAKSFDTSADLSRPQH